MAKKSPPRPKSTKNLPPGLAAYWAKRGVGKAKPKATKKKK